MELRNSSSQEVKADIYCLATPNASVASYLFVDPTGHHAAASRLVPSLIQIQNAQFVTHEFGRGSNEILLKQLIDLGRADDRPIEMIEELFQYPSGSAIARR